MLRNYTLIILFLLLPLLGAAQKNKQEVVKSIEKKADTYREAALNIWS